MDLTNYRIKCVDFIKKHKYIAIVLMLGIIFMIIPTSKNKTNDIKQLDVNQVSTKMDMNEELEEILSQISGAGKVKVLLTIASSEEIIYQADNHQTQTEQNNNSQVDTVTITDADRNENGLVKQTISPIYQGAVIVCQGADSSFVRLSIVEAVSRVTGLSSDRITVLKMK